MSKVKNIGLAKEGEKEIRWARENMPILSTIRDEFKKEKPFEGLRIGVTLHLEKKTAVLLEALIAGGASVTASSCNPLTTDDKVAAALSSKMEIYAWAGESNNDYYWCMNKVIESRPDIVIDDGCDLILALHKRGKKVIGGCEETTTGVIRLKAMSGDGKLLFPVFAVNNAYSKYLFDNRFGTGQSTVDAIMRVTNKLIAGKTVVVVGYGWCGRGIANRMRGMGANVVVVETATASGERESGYHRALEALYDGYRVMGIGEASRIGDIFVTATGNKHAIGKNHFKHMKDKAILANAGHFNVEIDVPSLKGMSRRAEDVKDNLTLYEQKDGRKLYLLSEGRLVNLARPSGQGHPIEIMDGSFGLQALCVRHLAEHRNLKTGVYDVPKGIDDRVARLALESQGIRLEKQTKEQERYSSSWDEGT
jgi:adenosylhomocysteinase